MTRSFAFSSLAIWLVAASASAQVVVDGEVDLADTVAFSFVPFDVPAGTVEIEVRHDDLSDVNILDWGLIDADGAFRGWGGGNSEPAIVGVDAASRSYLPGPIPAGEWRVVVGEALVEEPPGRYHVEVDLRTVATLPAAVERSPYVAVPALETGPRWYAGDFHVHSRESGDARPTLDEVATFARGRGLDFIELSEHNTDSHVGLILDAQRRHPALLFVPGVEYTTYAGHANGIGVTEYVSHLLGVDGLAIGDAVDAIHAQGALFSINHAALAVGSRCLGCEWEHDVAPDRVDAIEIATGGWSQTASLFTPRVIELWDEMLATGAHIPAIGGSDDHRAGEATGALDSPIGDPLTMVYAEELSVAALLEGVRAGRTYVRLQGPDDPTLEFTAGDAMVGDTVEQVRVLLRAHVEAGMGTSVRFVRNGERGEAVAVDADPFDFTLEVDAPYGDTADRWRAELVRGRDLRVITSHLYVAPQEGTPPPDAGGADAGVGPPADGGCGCRVGARPSRVHFGLVALLGAMLLLRRRRALR